MLASAASDIAVAVIAAVAVIVGAGLGFAGVVYTVRAQRTTRVLERDPNESASMAINEREARMKAEAERDVWKAIALERKDGMPSRDVPE